MRDGYQKRILSSNEAPPPAGAYSQGVAVGPFVFVAGQGAIDPVSRRVIGNTIEEQTELAIGNVRAVLQAAGVDLGDVVKATVHLADLRDFDAFNRVYERFFSEAQPVRTTVGSTLNGLLVEIDVIAVRQTSTDPT